MFRLILPAALLIASSAVSLGADPQASDAAGVWQTASGGYVQVYEDGGVWKGAVVGSVSNEARYDKENPDESKRDRRLLGATILNGLKYDGNGEFEGGTIYDPDNGKTYKAKATQQSPDALEVRGYIGFSLFGRSEVWKRVDKNAPHVHQDQLH